MLDNHVDVVDENTVTDIVRVLDEKEGARSDEFRYSGRKGETECRNLASNREKVFGEAVAKEGSYSTLADFHNCWEWRINYHR